jgi:hypothetical protein
MILIRNLERWLHLKTQNVSREGRKGREGFSALIALTWLNQPDQIFPLDCA